MEHKEHNKKKYIFFLNVLFNHYFVCIAFLSTKIMILYLSKIVHTESLGWICLSVVTFKFKIQIKHLSEEKKKNMVTLQMGREKYLLVQAHMSCNVPRFSLLPTVQGTR